MKEQPKFVFNRNKLIRPQVLTIPDSGIKAFVERLAQQHNVTHVDSKMNQFGIAVTNLAGDSVRPDSTRDLLIALTRSKKP